METTPKNQKAYCAPTLLATSGNASETAKLAPQKVVPPMAQHRAPEGTTEIRPEKAPVPPAPRCTIFNSNKRRFVTPALKTDFHGVNLRVDHVGHAREARAEGDEVAEERRDGEPGVVEHEGQT